jgi:hypothetical protein
MLVVIIMPFLLLRLDSIDLLEYPVYIFMSIYTYTVRMAKEQQQQQQQHQGM